MGKLTTRKVHNATLLTLHVHCTHKSHKGCTVVARVSNFRTMADAEVDICPICCEDMDEQDLSFFPCECGYQVCMFCWKKIQSEGNSKCPACRTEYSEDKVTFKARAEVKL